MSNSAPLTLHPLELPRIAGFRDYGFDNLDVIVDFAKAQILGHGNKPFTAVFESDKKYLFLAVTSFPSAPNPYFDIELEVGFIDFQDQEKVRDSGVELRLFEKDAFCVLIQAIDKTGKPTPEVEYAITQIINGDYLDLSSN